MRSVDVQKYCKEHSMDYVPEEFDFKTKRKSGALPTLKPLKDENQESSDSEYEDTEESNIEEGLET